jgi:ankyrin repeat protein
LLIASGANVSRRNQDGATALAWAKELNEDDLVKELRRAGAQ